MKEIFYNLKLVFTPVKIVICLAIASLTPLLISTRSMDVYIDRLPVYMSIIGIIAFADISLIDKKSGMDEIIYLTRSSVFKRYLYRIISAMIIILLLALLSGFLFVLKLSFKGISINYYLLSQLGLLRASLPYIFFVGIISMTIGNIFRSSKIAYLIGILYWGLNLTYRMQEVISNISGIKSLLLLGLLLGSLILINIYLDSLSPQSRGVFSRKLKIGLLKEKIIRLFKDYDILKEE